MDSLNLKQLVNVDDDLDLCTHFFFYIFFVFLFYLCVCITLGCLTTSDQTGQSLLNAIGSKGKHAQIF